jgi:hypothetical protein
MQRNHQMGTAAGEAKHVRLICFEHTIRILEFMGFSTKAAKVSYEVEQAHL